MTNNDSGFVGSIPDLYDRNIGPLMMVPYAGDIAARLSDMATGRLLEVAAGTGIVTAALALALPRAQLIATDLNREKLTVAAVEKQRLLGQHKELVEGEASRRQDMRHEHRYAIDTLTDFVNFCFHHRVLSVVRDRLSPG